MFSMKFSSHPKRIFTTIDNNSVLTSYETRMAAKLQEQHVVIHPCGYRVAKFISVVMRRN